jgi:hypothetical protein
VRIIPRTATDKDWSFRRLDFDERISALYSDEKTASGLANYTYYVLAKVEMGVSREIVRLSEF